MVEVTLDFLSLQISRVLDEQRRTNAELVDIKERLRSIELGVVDVRREILTGLVERVRADHRIDAMDARMSRIERRLDLNDDVPA